MSDSVKVYVVKVGSRPNFYLEWEDPITQRPRRKVTDVKASGLAKERKAAERLAAELALQLNSGVAALPSKYQWAEFRRRYETEVVPGLASQTAVKVQVVLDRVESILNPQRLLDMTEQRLSHLVASLRGDGVAETTIKGYLAHLKAALNWAVRQKLLVTLPSFPKIQRAKRSSGTPMKGRPVTQEELERMLKAVAAVVGQAKASDWHRYLVGLWLSGLRLEESLDLWWDRHDKIHPVFPKDGQPLFQIPGELEKGHTDRLLPMAPEFALLLQRVPEADRTGPVFSLNGRQGRLGSNQVSKIVSKIGKAAGVKVYAHPKDPAKVKFASAHDLRRAFGARWAARVMPAQLMELMRHESIETTLRFYVGTNAQRTNDAIWDAYRRDQQRGADGFPDFSSDLATSGGADAAPPEKRPVLENTERNQTRPGVIRTHDQGIMSADDGVG
jgi:integrase